MNCSYKNKMFFELVDGKTVGPLTNLYYLASSTLGQNTHTYCQVMDGVITTMFKKEDILVVDLNWLVKLKGKV